ncbi:MAG: fibronectin type III domain-containing protein [Clostridia bacterium]|nr:fibronectin type III domain-containing protein [Clostridia bacterium]
MMRKMKCLAALLALCLLSGLIPAATMEDLTIDGNADTPMEIVLGDDTAEDGLDIPPEIGVSENDGLTLEPDGIDLSGLELALEEEYNDAATLNGDVGETLVHIVKPEDGSTVGTGDVEIWLTWTFPGGDAKEIAAKLLPTTVEVLKDGNVIGTQRIQAPVNLVFTAEGARYLNVTLSDPGDYTIRASVPGSSGFSKVTVTAVGSVTTTTPSPTATPKPTPEPIITTDSEGFGVDQTGVLRTYTGSAKDIVIPRNATAIGENVFKGSDITSVTLHDGITRILDFAFCETDALSTVNFADGLKTIGEGAFFQSALKKLTLPGTVTTVGTGAFHQCGSLTSVNVPASVTSMGGYMFSLSEKLTTVIFEAGSKLKTFNTDMFYGDKALEKVILPDSLETLGEFAFAGCTSLKSLTLPSSLTAILDYAFENCTGLTELTIPASVNSMAFHTFDGCSNLTLIVVEGSYGEQYVKEMANIPYRVISEPAPTPTSAPTATPEPKVKLSKCTASVKSQVYTGKLLKPAVNVKYGKKTLKKGTDYTVTYKNNKAVGTATATLTGKGKYTGTKKVTFKILPPKVALSKLKAGTKSFTATWKKGKANTGYQLQYALKKSFSGAKSVEIKKSKAVSTTVKGLKTGKTYYVRVRVCRTVGKNTYYSAWSNVRSVKVK